MNKKLLLAIYLLSLIAYINCTCNCCDQCDEEEEEQPQGTCPALKKISSSFRGTGYATRYWDCCKPSCSWSNNAGWGKEARECDVRQNVLSDKNSKSLCDWGVSTTCLSQVPFTISGCDNLGFAFASVPGGSGAICGRCFALEFTGEGKYETRKNHKALAGKKLIVMASNIGYDVVGGQFDILIPGGGEGYFTGKCSQVLGNFQTTQYGGLLSDCENVEENEEDEEGGEESDEEDKEIDYKKFEKEDEPIQYKQYMFSCVGIGLKNVARIEL